MTKKRESRVEEASQVLSIDELKFTDVFDLAELQKLQDAFAAATGVASIITDIDGTPFTEPSQFCEMCQLVRKTELGRANCYKSDAELGKPHPGGPILQPCLSGGLWDGGVSIYLGDRHIGNWLIGQILTGDAEVERVLAYGKQVGADPEAFRQAVDKVTRMPLERFEKVGEALYVFSQQLSRMALQNAQQKIEITRRERAEEDTQRAFALFAAGPVMIFRWQNAAGWPVEYVSPNVANILGYPPEKLISGEIPYASIVHPDDLARVAEEVQAYSASGVQTFSQEYRLVSASGEVRWTYDQTHIVRDAQGAITHYDGYMQDITERKLIETTLAENTARLRNILDAIPLGMHLYRLEPDGRLVFAGANAAADLLLGVDNSIFVGKTIEEAFPPLTQTEVPTRYREAAGEGKPWQTQQIAYDQGEIQGAFEVYAFQTSPGEMAAGFLDVTARMRGEAERARLNAILESTSDLVSTTTPDGRITYMNEAGRKMVGWPADEDLRKHTIPDVHPAWVLETVEKVGVPMAIARGLWQGESALLRVDGTEIPVSQVIMAHKSPSGELEYISTVMRDISEMRAAQTERERFTTRLNTAADISAQATAILDPDELLQAVIPLIKERFGLYYVHVYTLDEEGETLHLRAGYGEPGRIMLERGHSIPLSREASLVATAARTGKPVLVNDVTQNPNFMPNPLLPDTRAEVAVPALAGGKVLGVFDVQHDQADYFTQADLDVFLTLTGQIAISLQNARYVEEVARQRAFYDGIITNLPVGVWAVDQQFKPLLVNPAGRAMMGREVKDQAGGAYVENYEVININTGELYDNTQLPLVKAVTQGGTYTAVDAGVRWPDGTVVPQLINAAPLLDPDGTQTGAVVIFIDATEQQRAQAAVRESEARQRMILETLPIGVVIIRSSNETILYANQVYAELIGVASAQDLLGKVVPVTFEDPADLQGLTYKLQEQGQVESQEMRLKCPDGRVLWVLVSILPIQFGAEQFMLSSLVDITARKQAEAEREQFAVHLRVASEITTEISAILDADALFETLVQLTKERFNLYHAQYYDLDEATQTLTLRVGYGQAGQMMKQRGYRIPLKGGRDLAARAAHIRDVVVAHDLTQEADYAPNMLLLDARSEVALPLIVGGRVLGVLDVLADQTGYFTPTMVDVFKTVLGQVLTALQNVQYFAQQRGAEVALRDSSEQIRAMFDAMGDGVIVSNMIGEITDMNEASFALLGYAGREDLLHHNILEMIAPADRSQASVGWVTAMESGSSGVQPVTLQRKDGSTFAGEMTAALLRDAEGNPVGFVNICRNVSERK